MRITESTLRKIIREELDAVVGEAPDGIKPIGSVPGNLSPRFRKYFQKLAAAGKKLERAIGAKRKASNVDLKLGIKQVPIKKLEKFDELVGKIMKGKLSAEQAAEEYKKFNPKAPMEEADVRLGTYSGDLKGMEEAAHEPAGELVYSAALNGDPVALSPDSHYTVYKIIKGAGVGYGGDREGYRSSTLSKVGDFTLYINGEPKKTYSSLAHAQNQIKKRAARSTRQSGRR